MESEVEDLPENEERAMHHTRRRGHARGRGQGRGQESGGRMGRGRKGRERGGRERGGRGSGWGMRGRGHLSEEPDAAENQANHEQHLVVRKAVFYNLYIVNGKTTWFGRSESFKEFSIESILINYDLCPNLVQAKESHTVQCVVLWFLIMSGYFYLIK